MLATSAMPPRNTTSAQPDNSLSGRCACKGCQFCSQGVPCDSFLPDDLLYESCDPFCQQRFASTHCMHVNNGMRLIG